MNQRKHMGFGLLGVAHVLVAVVLLPVTAFLGIFAIPVLVPGLVWLAILGIRLWRPSPSVRKALRITHAVLAPFAVLLVIYGNYSLAAARRSAEAGGGLLGAFGLIPIVMGILTGALAVVSLIASQAAPSTSQSPSTSAQGGDIDGAA